jgi:hypothetical protein
VLNYGRIKNNVIAQDARFQQAVLTYRDTVFRANEEVENGIVGFLREQDRVASLTMSTNAAARSVEIATKQYEKGTIDYQPLLDSERVLTQQGHVDGKSWDGRHQLGRRLQSPRRRLAGAATTTGPTAGHNGRTCPCCHATSANGNSPQPGWPTAFATLVEPIAGLDPAYQDQERRRLLKSDLPNCKGNTWSGFRDSISVL